MAPRSEEQNSALRERTAAQILDAAVALFAERGFAASTVELAARAGVSKGTVFHHFPGKDDLIAALVERSVTASLDAWDACPPGTAPDEMLRGAVAAALAGVRAQPALYRIAFMASVSPEAAPALERAHAALRPRLEAHGRRMAEIFRALGRPDPAADALLFQAALNGLGQAALSRPDLLDQLPLDRIAETLAGAFR
jgi:AcrR family transcriptional regulator